MRPFRTLLATLLAGLALAGCSSNNEVEQSPAQDLYSKGQTYLQEEDYTSAIRYLEAVDGRFRHSTYGEQTLLSLAYAQYKVGEYYKAIDVAERFVRSYPNSPSMDYVYYLAALSNARLGDNFIQDFFRVNRASRAVENVRNAYGSFKLIVDNFPQSQYAADSRQWMAFLFNRLAEHELEIVKYYMKRDAYVAVANRVEEMMRFYPESKPTADALPYLRDAFKAMGIEDSAAKVEALIEQNKNREFPSVSKPAYGEQF
ncbi:outer membrane assembly protein BamD [Pasteurellaceae bacterium RH1A]|nr:outer membrane assembly protein BamD [Pasteurellaceae bacterium RH1A]